jgi:hypothetical protein
MRTHGLRELFPKLESPAERAAPGGLSTAAASKASGWAKAWECLLGGCGTGPAYPRPSLLPLTRMSTPCGKRRSASRFECVAIGWTGHVAIEAWPAAEGKRVRIGAPPRWSAGRGVRLRGTQGKVPMILMGTPADGGGSPTPAHAVNRLLAPRLCRR